MVSMQPRPATEEYTLSHTRIQKVSATLSSLSRRHIGCGTVARGTKLHPKKSLGLESECEDDPMGVVWTVAAH